MSFFILEAVHGLGMPDDDIPLRVKQEQMKVSPWPMLISVNQSVSCDKNANELENRPSTSPSPSIIPLCFAQKLQSSSNTTVSSRRRP